MRSNYMIRLILILIAIIPFGYSQEADSETNKSCLWKVESDTNTVYLLGSIHFLSENEYPLNNKIEEVFEKTNHIVFETNLDCTKTPGFQQLMLSQAKYNQNKSLESELSKETYQLLREKLKSLGMNITNFNTFRPWFVSITLTVRKVILLGFNPNIGIDKYFFNKAKAKGKSIYGLESPKFQIELMSDLGKELEEEFLVQTIEEYDSVSVILGKLVESWKKGDLTGLDKTMNRSMDKYPELRKKLLIDRNLNWVEKITEFLNENKQYMVIVGAGHFPGEFGLINQLIQKGYEVTQM